MPADIDRFWLLSVAVTDKRSSAKFVFYDFEKRTLIQQMYYGDFGYAEVYKRMVRIGYVADDLMGLDRSIKGTDTELGRVHLHKRHSSGVLIEYLVDLIVSPDVVLTSEDQTLNFVVDEDYYLPGAEAYFKKAPYIAIHDDYVMYSSVYTRWLALKEYAICQTSYLSECVKKLKIGNHELLVNATVHCKYNRQVDLVCSIHDGLGRTLFRNFDSKRCLMATPEVEKLRRQFWDYVENPNEKDAAFNNLAQKIFKHAFFERVIAGIYVDNGVLCMDKKLEMKPTGFDSLVGDIKSRKITLRV